MLFNADLLSVDGEPLPGAIRCSFGSPTAGELEAVGALGLDVSAVLYLPAASAGAAGVLSAGQPVTVRLDGMEPQDYEVLHVNDRIRDVLSHRQVFLTGGQIWLLVSGT